MNNRLTNKSVCPELAIGVSSCLLGKPVRYDGSHKYNRYITKMLGKVFIFVPVCPEVETGMGVPRETIDLHGRQDNLRLIGNETGIDWTTSMNRWSERRVQQKDIKQVCGFVLKSKSPTCGLNSARIIGPTGRITQRGRGLFANALCRRYLSMPIIEERDLNDLDARDNFIVRLFAKHRLNRALGYRPTIKKITEFHEREVCLLNSHSQNRRRQLDQLLQLSSSLTLTRMRDQYVRQFMAALCLRSTIARNTRVMNDVRRILKEYLSKSEQTTVTKSFEAYRKGHCSQYKPLLLLKKYSEKYMIHKLLDQSWLFPDEREILLRFNV